MIRCLVLIELGNYTVMDKWSKACELKPCYYCYEDWEDYYPSYIGTFLVLECGDGCCWNRKVCDVCNGTGIDNHE